MKKWIANILLGFCAALLTLVLLEIALRFVYPAHESWRLYSIPDPELGWALQPGAQFTRQVPGSFVKVQYNAQGYRDTDWDAPVAGGATRIVVLGDSYMEANMVPLEAVFHKQMERLAVAEGRQLKVWNLGVAGYGTLQEYLAYKKAGSKRKPDLVLLAFYLHNDVRNNAEHLNISAQALRAGKRKRPFLDEENESDWLIHKPDFEEIQKKFLKRKTSLSFRIRHNSVLLTLFRNARRTVWSYINPLHSAGALSMHRCNSSELYEKAWLTSERILGRLKQEVEADGAQLVVFSVPALFDVDLSAVREHEKNSGDVGPKLCIENSPGYARLREVLHRNGIIYVDLVPTFRTAATKEKRNLFVIGDWHWNSEGHALAAQSVYDALKMQELLAQ